MAPTTGVVLVTGASAGIGRAVADRLAGDGSTVVGASRRGTGGEGDPAAWEGVEMDVDSDASVSAGVADVERRHGRIDAVVASAGWGIAGAVEDTTIEEAKAQLETNFWGVARVVRAVLPAMRHGGGGRIVIVSSIGGILGIPFQAYYSASKFAVEGLAESMSYEVAPFGVHVTLVEPGNVRTDFTDSRRTAAAAGGATPYAEAFAKAVAVMERDERNGVPADDVARVVAKVLAARRPPRRLSVGKAGERVGTVAKRLLPFRVFEAAAKGSLGV